MSATVCKPADFTPDFIEARDVKGLDFVTLPRRLIDVLYTWQQRSVDRKGLLAISDHMLADIGISRIDALREAAKPFWKA